MLLVQGVVIVNVVLFFSSVKPIYAREHMWSFFFFFFIVFFRFIILHNTDKIVSVAAVASVRRE